MRGRDAHPLMSNNQVLSGSVVGLIQHNPEPITSKEDAEAAPESTRRTGWAIRQIHK